MDQPDTSGKKKGKKKRQKQRLGKICRKSEDFKDNDSCGTKPEKMGIINIHSIKKSNLA